MRPPIRQETRRDVLSTLPLTGVSHKYLQTLAECYCSTAKDLAWFYFDNTAANTIRRVTSVLERLAKRGYVETMTYQPEDPDGYRGGRLPLVFGMTGRGVSLAERHYPQLGARELSQSRNTLEHEVKCARTFFHFVKMCEQNGFEAHCQRADLYRRVDKDSYIDPDWLFAAYHPRTDRTKYFFLELENEKKNFRKLDEKFAPYQKLHGTEECLRQWGDFSEFTVIIQFANQERHDNFRAYLAGECRCTSYRGRLRHTCRPSAPLKCKTFWLTTDADIWSRISGRIFTTPADYACASYSFLDP